MPLLLKTDFLALKTNPAFLVKSCLVHTSHFDILMDSDLVKSVKKKKSCKMPRDITSSSLCSESKS